MQQLQKVRLWIHPLKKQVGRLHQRGEDKREGSTPYLWSLCSMLFVPWPAISHLVTGTGSRLSSTPVTGNGREREATDQSNSPICHRNHEKASGLKSWRLCISPFSWADTLHQGNLTFQWHLHCSPGTGPLPQTDGCFLEFQRWNETKQPFTTPFAQA